MATVTDTLASAVSGSVGDDVHSHNQHGPYIRRRTTPTDPQTARQVAQRRHWARSMFRWNNVLTAAQRESWRVYAQNTPIDNRMGDAQRVHALAMYMRCNVARTDRVLGFVDDAPTTFRQPIWTYPIADTLASVGFVFLTIDPTDEWANQTGGALLLYISPIMPATINFHKAPLRYAGSILGHDTSPPAVLNFFLDPWPIGLTIRRWARTRVVLADGRVSQQAHFPFVDNV